MKKFAIYGKQLNSCELAVLIVGDKDGCPTYDRTKDDEAVPPLLHWMSNRLRTRNLWVIIDHWNRKPLTQRAIFLLKEFAEVHPLGGGKQDLARVGAMLMEHGEAIQIGPAKGRWTLSNTSRCAVLAELARQGKLTEAVRANADKPDNPTQREIAMRLGFPSISSSSRLSSSRSSRVCRRLRHCAGAVQRKEVPPKLQTAFQTAFEASASEVIEGRSGQ